MLSKYVAILLLATATSAHAATKQEEQKTLPAFAASGNTGDDTLNDRFKRTMPLTLNIFTPPKIFKDYADNEVKADIQYKNRLFVIKGKISKISKDFTDTVYLEFNNPSNQFEGVNAYLYQTQICGTISNPQMCDAPTAAASLKKKDTVFLDCYGNGMTVGTPMLKDCLIRLPEETNKKPTK